MQIMNFKYKKKSRTIVLNNLIKTFKIRIKVIIIFYKFQIENQKLSELKDKNMNYFNRIKNKIK